MLHNKVITLYTWLCITKIQSYDVKILNTKFKSKRKCKGKKRNIEKTNEKIILQRKSAYERPLIPIYDSNRKSNQKKYVFITLWPSQKRFVYTLLLQLNDYRYPNNQELS